MNQELLKWLKAEIKHPQKALIQSEDFLQRKIQNWVDIHWWIDNLLLKHIDYVGHQALYRELALSGFENLGRCIAIMLQKEDRVFGSLFNLKKKIEKRIKYYGPRFYCFFSFLYNTRMPKL